MPTPEWPSVADLPPLVTTDGLAVPADEAASLLDLLRHGIPASMDPTFEDHHPQQPWRRTAISSSLRISLDEWRARCGGKSLDSWTAVLLQAWLTAIGTGTARKVRWMVPAAALLGGDACAALLGAHLRGENYNLRCKGEIGVTALIEIGTRGALLELAQLGKKHPKKSRGEHALAALESIAAAQGLSPDQLQDRILPDGGLNAQGQRIFDYGPRQFAVELSESLAWVLRAPDGRHLTTLPKPTARDDALRAADARLSWKVAKTQLQNTARWLAHRFEGAMISGEAWTPADFTTLFQTHPLARHLVRRLLWTGINASGRPSFFFRVAEDNTLASADDKGFSLPSETIGIRPIHPFELEPDTLALWQQRFTDYQIVGPFPQLDRPSFRAEPGLAAQQVLTELPCRRVEAKGLIFPLETRGWERDSGADGGMLVQHTRRFVQAGVVACLDYEPGAFLGDLLGSETQTLRQLYFVRAGDPFGAERALPIGTIPPIAYSETLRDLHALVAAP